MSLVQEGYKPTVIAADGLATFPVCAGIGCFLAKTAGTITIVDSGTTIVNAHPVAAGGFYAMPFSCVNTTSVTVQLAGGASGTVGTF